MNPTGRSLFFHLLLCSAQSIALTVVLLSGAPWFLRTACVFFALITFWLAHSAFTSTFPTRTPNHDHR
jgi:hypothetical protein